MNKNGKNLHFYKQIGLELSSVENVWYDDKNGVV